MTEHPRERANHVLDIPFALLIERCSSERHINLLGSLRGQPRYDVPGGAVRALVGALASSRFWRLSLVCGKSDCM